MSEYWKMHRTACLLNASDADESINKEIVYLFSNLVVDNVKSKFVINANSGDITVQGKKTGL